MSIHKNGTEWVKIVYSPRFLTISSWSIREGENFRWISAYWIARREYTIFSTFPSKVARIAASGTTIRASSCHPSINSALVESKTRRLTGDIGRRRISIIKGHSPASVERSTRTPPVQSCWKARSRSSSSRLLGDRNWVTRPDERFSDEYGVDRDAINRRDKIEAREYSERKGIRGALNYSTLQWTRCRISLSTFSFRWRESCSCLLPSKLYLEYLSSVRWLLESRSPHITKWIYSLCVKIRWKV